MQKFVFVLIALLLVASFAIAVEGGSEQSGSGLDDQENDAIGQDAGANETPNDSLIAPSPTAAGAIVVSESDTAIGESIAGTEAPKPAIVHKAVTRLHLIGNGIAISQSDAFDFMHAKVVVGAAKVATDCASSDCVNGATEVKRLGVLLLDGKNYHLKDVAVSEKEISAEIYGPTTDASAASASIGQIKVKLFEKPGRDVWAGNMVLNGKAYNVYFLGVERVFKVAEITEKIGDYCKENPDDARCKKVLPTCAADKEKCKEKAADYCKSNPTNIGCLQLEKQYCLKNATDVRCKEYLKGLCEKYPKLPHCIVSTVAGQTVVGINPEAVSAITTEAGEKIQEMVVSKIREKLKNLKSSIESIKSTLPATAASNTAANGTD